MSIVSSSFATTSSMAAKEEAAGDAVAGSIIVLSVNSTSFAVSGVPSWNLTPSFK